MDDRRFDALTRACTAGAPRRGIVRFLAAGALAAAWDLAIRGGWRNAEAKCKKPCGPCRACKQGKCTKKKPDGTACGSGGRCQQGRCCTPDCAGKPCGEADGCGGVCTAQQGCGASCGTGQRPCALPAGGVACIPDDGTHCCTQDDCGGPASDLTCDHAGDFVCRCREAGVGRCPPPHELTCHTCCPGGSGSGGCPAGQVCGGVSQRCECPAGFAIRGACGARCVCGPTCALVCPPGWTCCGDDGCVYTSGCGPATNGCHGYRNCGSCGHHCAESEACCSGACVRLDDEANCGYCGAACPAGTRCCGPGNCQPTCPS
jgi:hypothetical protein